MIVLLSTPALMSTEKLSKCKKLWVEFVISCQNLLLQLLLDLPALAEGQSRMQRTTQRPQQSNLEAVRLKTAKQTGPLTLYDLVGNVLCLPTKGLENCAESLLRPMSLILTTSFISSTKDVFRLEVSMANILGVKLLQSRSHLMEMKFRLCLLNQVSSIILSNSSPPS